MSVVTTSIVSTVGGPVTTTVARTDRDVLGREITTATAAATDALNDDVVADALTRLGVEYGTAASQSSADAQEAALRAEMYAELSEQSRVRAEQEAAIRAQQFAELTGTATQAAAEAKQYADVAQAAAASAVNVLDPETGLIKDALLPAIAVIDGGSP
jgi:hypothetical protein